MWQSQQKKSLRKVSFIKHTRKIIYSKTLTNYRYMKTKKDLDLVHQILQYIYTHTYIRKVFTGKINSEVRNIRNLFLKQNFYLNFIYFCFKKIQIPFTRNSRAYIQFNNFRIFYKILFPCLVQMVLHFSNSSITLLLYIKTLVFQVKT